VIDMSEEALREIASTLKELLKWSRFAGMQQLRTILSQNLGDESEALIYELSDGSRGTREIAKLAGIGSNATVARLWKKWSKIGIVEQSTGFPGRCQRICSLEEVGLPIPTCPGSVERGESQEDEVNERDR
jgi:hypothetical protein